MKRLSILIFFCGAAFAQNTDLGLLIGISSATSTTSASERRVSSSVGAHGQINLAFQMRETTAGRLYLELPVLLGGHVRSTVGSGVYASTGAILYVTPGVRWNIPLHSRASLYATAGAGLAGFGGDSVAIQGGVRSATSGFTSTFAGAVGGGLDLRLSRLVSLRGEVRDFVTKAGFDGTEGHNHVVFGFGLGFHW